MRLIDVDAFKTEHRMADMCGDCERTKRELDCNVCDCCDWLDNAPTVDQWISVKDRLPDKQPCEYLVVNANNVETAICLDNRWITPRRVIKITHWMPLPEPPEVKQDD